MLAQCIALHNLRNFRKIQSLLYFILKPCCCQLQQSTLKLRFCSLMVTNTIYDWLHPRNSYTYFQVSRAEKYLFKAQRLLSPTVNSSWHKMRLGSELPLNLLLFILILLILRRYPH